MKTIYKTTCARLMTLLVLALLSVSNVWGETGTIKITRSSFPSGALAYNTTDNWSVTASTGETISGVGDLYSTKDQTTMQSKNTGVSTMYHNTVAAPGPITKITLKCASGTTRTYTVYLNKTTAITSTSGGTSKGTIAPTAGNTASLSLNAEDGWHYFWLNLAGGASILDYIEIEYEVEDEETKTLTSVAVSGTPTTTTYEVGEEFDPTGLVVTGTYDDASTETITKGIEWTVNPSVALTAGTTSVSFTATVGTITSSSYTVNGLKVTAALQGDKLTTSSVGSPGSYKEWTGKSGSLGEAEYAGQSSGGESYIQMRNQSPSGIVSTKSGGNIRKIKVDWNSTTTSGRSLKIYGSNTAYTESSNLYNESTSGTVLGTIVKGTTELKISGDYAYVGVLPVGGALYLNSITFFWEEVNLTDPDVSFSNESPEVAIFDGTYTQVVTTNSDGAVSYTSSNNEVATVENDGVVTLLKEGTVTITASTARTDTYKEGSASYTLTITDNRSDNEIAFTEEAITKHVGDESFSNIYTATDETGTVTFASTNPNVATVSTNGIVNIVGTGTTTISIKIAANANYKEGQASYVLTVIPHTTGDGTISNPFTVSDVVTLNNTLSGNYWVKGTICGYADGSLDNIKTTDFTGSHVSNIVLSEGEGTNIIGVQLPSGAIRDALNLNDHSYLLNTEIYVYGSLEKYFKNNPGVKNTSNCAKVVIISSVGWATACLPFNATITSDNATAYYVTGTSGTALTKVEAEVIPAGEGILLKSNNGADATATFTVSTETVDDATGNMMKGSLEGETFEETGYTYYILANGENGLGFYYQGAENTTGASVTCAAGKAVLAVPASAGIKSFFSLDDETTSIHNSQFTIHNSENDVIYNLNGQVVGKDYKGIVIVNGKKMLNK